MSKAKDDLHPIARRHLTESLEMLNEKRAKLEEELKAGFQKKRRSEDLWNIAGRIDELHGFQVWTMNRLGTEPEKSEKTPGTKLLLALRKKQMGK